MANYKLDYTGEQVNTAIGNALSGGLGGGYTGTIQGLSEAFVITTNGNFRIINYDSATYNNVLFILTIDLKNVTIAGSHRLTVPYVAQISPSVIGELSFFIPYENNFTISGSDSGGGSN